MSARRNKAVGIWHTTRYVGVTNRDSGVRVMFSIEQADMLDTLTNNTYYGGAFRVLRDGKPIRGKGGSVPFLGESAWCAADRKLSDLCWDYEIHGFAS